MIWSRGKESVPPLTRCVRSSAAAEGREADCGLLKCKSGMEIPLMRTPTSSGNSSGPSKSGVAGGVPCLSLRVMLSDTEREGDGDEV